MKSSIRGALLITICISVVMTSVYALYKEMTGRIDKNSADAIGTIYFKKKNADRKYAEFVIWEDISNNSPVYNYDSVRTFKDSAAYIRLKNGIEISLDENTMIILIADENGVKLNFDRGSVSAKSGKDSGKISLNVKDVSISMENGEIAVKKGGSAVDLNVSAGEAFVTSGGNLKKIENNHAARIIDGKTEVRKILITPDYPPDNSVFVTYKNSDKIHLKWKSDSSSDETVQVSKDYQFNNIVYSAKTSGKNQSFDIPPGDYYWRAVSKSEFSPVRKFIILKDSSPEQLYPLQDERVSVTGDDAMVSFKWNRSEYASSCKFEIAGDQNLTKPIKNLILSINSISIDDIPAGNLWWRVTRIYPDGFLLLDNSVSIQKFVLVRTDFSRIKPKPKNDGKMYASIPAGNIIFSWDGGSGVKGYTVDISSDVDFKHIIKSHSVNGTFYNSEALPEGDYFWRVTANYDDGESLVSDAVSLTVKPPLPVVYLTPGNGSILDDSSDTLKLAWEDISDAGRYLLEISSDSDFKNIVSSLETDLKSYIIKKPDPRKYFWRVSILNKNGMHIVPGKLSVFTIPEKLQKPLAVSPRNMGVINLDDTDVIEFQWEKVAGADSYELEIFQRASGRDRSLIVFNTGTEKIELKNFKIFNPGTIVWVVRAKKTVKGKVTAAGESDRNYFVLKVSENIEAPKLNVPERIYVR